MRGLVVGSERWAADVGKLEFETKFEFVRAVDLSGSVELEEGRVRALEVTGNGYPWQSERSPFPVGLQLLRAREWERGRRVSREIRSCGEGCYALEGLTWGRSFLWVDEGGSLASAFVPTPFAPLV